MYITLFVCLQVFNLILSVNMLSSNFHQVCWRVCSWSLVPHIGTSSSQPIHSLKHLFDMLVLPQLDWAPKISSPEEKESYSLWDSSVSDIYHEVISENTDYEPGRFLIFQRLPNYFQAVITNDHLCSEVAAELKNKAFVIHHRRYHYYQDKKILGLIFQYWNYSELVFDFPGNREVS